MQILYVSIFAKKTTTKTKTKTPKKIKKQKSKTKKTKNQKGEKNPIFIRIRVRSLQFHIFCFSICVKKTSFFFSFCLLSFKRGFIFLVFFSDIKHIPPCTYFVNRSRIYYFPPISFFGSAHYIFASLKYLWNSFVSAFRVFNKQFMRVDWNIEVITMTKCKTLFCT